MEVIFDTLYGVLIDLFDYLYTIYSSVGLRIASFFIGLCTIYALYKFILSPYLSGSSDSAKYSKKREE